MKAHATRRGVIAAVLLLVAFGCSSPMTPPPTMGAPISVFPAGSYSGTGSSRLWSWDLPSDGTYFASGPHSTERGTYTLTGNQIVFKGNLCGDIEGTYTWVSDGKSLSFTVVQDDCVDRRGVIAAGP